MFDYLKNILTLSGGTLVSQLILILSIPILTRIYSPSDLGITAFFLAIANILSSLSTGKYELAIFLPKNKFWIHNLFFATILINFCFFVMSLIFIIPIQYFLNNYFMIDYSLVWFFSIPLIFFFNGLNFSFNAFLNKNKRYNYISIGRILRNIILAISSISLGIYFLNPIFLIFSHILSLFVTNLFLFFILHRLKILQFSNFNFRRMIILLRKYHQFPLYTLPATFVNIFSNQMPIIVLTAYFGSHVSGMYSLVTRTMGAPSKLISSATSEVFRQKASEEFNLSGNCKNLFLKTFQILLIISVIPFSLIVFYGPDLFSLIFGKDWIQAGYYARYLSIFYLLRFCVSPLSFTLLIANRQNYNLLWQLTLLLFTNIGLYVGYYYNNVNYSIINFSIIYSLMYIVYFNESFKSAKGNIDV